MAKKPENRFQRIEEMMAAGIIRGSDALVPAYRGGSVPYGKEKMSQAELYYRWKLLNMPGMRLTPDQLQERKRIYDEWYKNKELVERKEFQQWGQRYEAKMYGGERVEPAVEAKSRVSEEPPSMEEELL